MLAIIVFPTMPLQCKASAVLNQTSCYVSGDILQYRLKESVYHRRTRQVRQLFTYLLMQKLFSSCIRRYLVSRACDWVMPALSAVLLTFSFQFSLIFFNISLSRPHQSHIYGSGPHQHCSVLLDNIGQRTLPKIWVSPFLMRSVRYDTTYLRALKSWQKASLV